MGLLRYEWKTAEEVLWAMLIGGTVFAFQFGAELDLEAVISDPWAWVITAAGGLIRASCAAGLIGLRKLLGR